MSVGASSIEVNAMVDDRIEDTDCTIKLPCEDEDA